MNKSSNNLLTGSEVIFMVFASMVGVGILAIGNDAAQIAYEDGWIATAVGGAYPLYMALIAMYFVRKFPNENILVISKKYLGKYFGSVLNFIFLAYIIFLTSAVVAGYVNIVRAFIEDYLTPYKIVIIVLLLTAYVCSMGLKVIGRISVIIFYITIIIFLLPMQALKVSSFANISPIGKTGILTILSASKTTIFAYMGVEIIFLIYPSVKEKNKFIKNAFIGIIITILIYTWATFISIYYLGADIVVKSNWPFLEVTESITISVVNNFRYIFMFLWTLTVFKAISSDYYCALIIVNDFVKKVHIKKLSYIVMPLVFIFSLRLSNIIEGAAYVPKLSEFCLVFNFAYVTLVAITVFIKEVLKKYTNQK